MAGWRRRAGADDALWVSSLDVLLGCCASSPLLIVAPFFGSDFLPSIYDVRKWRIYFFFEQLLFHMSMLLFLAGAVNWRDEACLAECLAQWK